MYIESSQLPEDSRVWIYQSSRDLSSEEEQMIADKTIIFLNQWTAHQQELKASFEIRHQRFLILMLDEKSAMASGCSIDKSLHFVQSLEKQLSNSFLDRLQLAYETNGTVATVKKQEFELMLKNGTIHQETIVFNNLIQTKAELNSSWRIPLRQSWHQSMI